MEKIFLLCISLIFSVFASCQGASEGFNDSSYYAKKIRIDIQQFKKKFGKFDEPYKIEFCVDTFEIEQLFRMKIKQNNANNIYAMSVKEQNSAYDKLLNKYYYKLLNALDKRDKNILVDAEKAWISFQRQNQNLISTIMSDKYFGGGSVQNMEELSLNTRIIKNRLEQIFSYYALIAEQIKDN